MVVPLERVVVVAPPIRPLAAGHLVAVVEEVGAAGVPLGHSEIVVYVDDPVGAGVEAVLAARAILRRRASL